METLKDEERFNSLKTHFGTEGRADQLTLAQFLALPEAIFESLLHRVTDFVVIGELSQIRKEASAPTRTDTEVAPYPQMIDVKASSLAKKNLLTFFTLPVCEYFGTNDFIHSIIKDSNTLIPTPILTFFPLSCMSFHMSGGSETSISRPNLKEVLQYILNFTNSKVKSTDNFREESEEDIRKYVKDYYFCSLNSKPEPIIVFKNVALLVSEAKGADVHMTETYAQAVQIASDAACRLKEKGFDISTCVIPFICCTGYNIQFGVVELIPDSFPVSYRLSSELSLLVRTDREKISSFVYALSNHLLRMKQLYESLASSVSPMPSILRKQEMSPRAVLADDYFFKPVLTKWIDLSEFVRKAHDDTLFLNSQLSHCLDIFRALSKAPKYVHRYVCFPVGMMGFPDATNQLLFHNYILQNMKRNFANVSLTAGHPILIFRDLLKDQWQTANEKSISSLLLERKDEFLLQLNEAFSFFYSAGVVHLDIRLENIFYRVQDSKLEIKITDWNDAMFRGDLIPTVYYQTMQNRPGKFPANVTIATEEFHRFSILRIQHLLEERLLETVTDRFAAGFGITVTTLNFLPLEDYPILSKIDHMNVDTLRRHLQDRNLDSSGAKKILILRLKDYEKSRITEHFRTISEFALK